MAQKHFVVVGAGLGGLAAALRLAHRGERVTILEKTDQVGGRNREIRVGECRFDAGPTLLMMRDPFFKLFEDVGERIQDHLPMKLCDPSYRVFYADGTKLEGLPNPERMAQAIAAFSGSKDADGFQRLLRDLKGLYETAIPNFVRLNFDSPLDFFAPSKLGHVLRHRMLANFAKRAATYVQDPRLQMLFSFQTMYLGMSPFEARWVYAVLTYMEYGEGIYFPDGGMVEICRSVARLAERKGAVIRLNTPVQRIEGNTVVLQSGETLRADAVICNADLPYAQRELTQTPRVRKHRNSCSAYMLYMDYDGELPDLLHHNVFFGPDFRGNLEDVFRNYRLNPEPAFYACVTARSKPDDAPKGRENLYILVPCPNLQRPFTASDACTIQQQVFGRLSQTIGFDPGRIRAQRDLSPNEWQSELNLWQGAAFGLSHDFLQSAYFRPANRSRENPHLYYVGASTTPGNGLPMVLISAELIEDRLMRDGKL